MRVISGLSIEPAALVITYISVPGDLRQNGLAQHHQLTVPHGSDYDQEIEAVTDALQALLDDALEDFPNVPAYEPEDPDEGDE